MILSHRVGQKLSFKLLFTSLPNIDGFLADRTNGRAYATVLRLSSVVRNVMYCG